MRSAPIFALILLGFVAACAKPVPPPEPEMVPVTVEPTNTGIYK